jgi:hypothetical protein
MCRLCLRTGTWGFPVWLRGRWGESKVIAPTHPGPFSVVGMVLTGDIDR